LRFHRASNLGTQATEKGELLKRELSTALVNSSRVRPPHGMGLMLGLFVHDGAGNADADLCDLLLESLKDNGIFAGKTGPGRNTLTFLPPLTVTDAEIGEFIAGFRKSVAAVETAH
jgi:4-aminobutyrate aminotransferase-like enzyme